MYVTNTRAGKPCAWQSYHNHTVLILKSKHKLLKRDAIDAWIRTSMSLPSFISCSNEMTWNIMDVTDDIPLLLFPSLQACLIKLSSEPEGCGVRTMPIRSVRHRRLRGTGLLGDIQIPHSSLKKLRLMHSWDNWSKQTWKWNTNDLQPPWCAVSNYSLILNQSFIDNVAGENMLSCQIWEVDDYSHSLLKALRVLINPIKFCVTH